VTTHSRTPIAYLLPLLLLVTAFAVMACEQRGVAAEPQGAQSGDGDRPTAATGPVEKLVFIFNSEACACERDRNQEAEDAMAAILQGNPPPAPLQRIDIAKDVTVLRTYQKQTFIGFLPVLLALDTQDRVVTKVEGLFGKQTTPLTELLKADERAK